MITKNDAIAIIEKKFPDRKVTKVGNYKGNFLLVAPSKELGPLNDTSTPYFIVNKNTGAVGKFTPTSDISGFTNAFKGG